MSDYSSLSVSDSDSWSFDCRKGVVLCEWHGLGDVMLKRSGLLRAQSRAHAAGLLSARRTLASSAASKGRVLLLYSGGLDTSVILRWLREEGYEVSD
jgi:hypothetical protein